jgi:hypothetical protein
MSTANATQYYVNRDQFKEYITQKGDNYSTDAQINQIIDDFEIFVHEKDLYIDNIKTSHVEQIK